MNKAKMIKIIKEDLGSTVSSACYYVHGNIPKRKFSKAKIAYVPDVLSYEDAIGLTDETIFRTGKKGFLFTFQGFYYTGCPKICPYSTPLALNSSFYHMPELNRMLARLNEASMEEAPSNWFHTLFKSLFNRSENKKSVSPASSHSSFKEQELEWNSKIEKLEVFRSCISELNSSIGLLGLSYKNHDASYEELVNSAVMLTGLLSGDALFVANYSTADLDADFAQQCTKYAETIAKAEDLLNSICPQQVQPIHIQRSIKRYRSSILRVADHSHRSEEENVEIIFAATNRLRTILNEILDTLDSMVDYCYEQMEHSGRFFADK